MQTWGGFDWIDSVQCLKYLFENAFLYQKEINSFNLPNHGKWMYLPIFTVLCELAKWWENKLFMVAYAHNNWKLLQYLHDQCSALRCQLVTKITNDSAILWLRFFFTVWIFEIVVSLLVITAWLLSGIAAKLPLLNSPTWSNYPMGLFCHV